MAKDILYIDNGANVNVAWTESIVISADGVNWNAINKQGLDVGLHSVNFNTNVPNSFPERNKESGPVITIKRSDQEGAILKFNPEKVVNQPGWIGDPQQAVSDIISWL
jgi:hypothetical protein